MQLNDLSPPVAALFRRYFSVGRYLEVQTDVRKAGVEPMAHYLEYGWREGRAPNKWFDPKYYAQYTYDLDPTAQDPFLHLLSRAIAERVSPKTLYSGIGDLLLRHAGGDGRVLSIKKPDRATVELLRPHFDKEYYLAENPEIGIDPLLHYLTIGWLEGRNPSPKFSARYYLQNNMDLRTGVLIEPLGHFVKYGKQEGWRPSETVEGATILDRFRENGDMAAYVAEAMDLDPMVGFPRAARHHTEPNTLNAGLLHAVESMRASFRGRRYKYIVAVPHIRMSGAARVAAIFTEILSKSVEPGEILVVITDSSETPYDHWFPEGVSRYDLSKLLNGMSQEISGRALLDLIRGVDCETLINVNSRLVWDTLRMFGRQMSQELHLANYLFTWDETPEGLRGGYPVQWLRDTADFHHLIFTDTRSLAQDVSDRMGYDDTIVRPLYTPVEASTGVATLSGPDERPRFLWAGRFDRQKRVDVLVAMAHANPHITFDVYGKAVLEDSGGLDGFKPPTNIRQMGTYDALEDVLKTPYHGFVYTAQWDGMPTILLDMALAGLPLVAPDVGGIAELVDDTTGWLIADCEDVDGYSAAMAEILSDAPAADVRAAAMKVRVSTMFSPDTYASELKKALKIS